MCIDHIGPIFFVTEEGAVGHSTVMNQLNEYLKLNLKYVVN